MNLDHCLFKEDIGSILKGEPGTVLTRLMLKVLEGGVADLIGDETQDRLRGIIHPEAVIAAKPEQGSLFVSSPANSAETLRVMDRKQEAFAKRLKSGHRVGWIDAGIHAAGRTDILRRNYRNTKEILTFATDFIEADLKSSANTPVGSEPVSVGEENFNDEIVLIPAEAAERSGNLPAVDVVSGIEAEVERVIRTVSNWYSPKLPARSIAVLMMSQRGNDRAQRVVDGLRERDLPVFWVTESADSRDRVGMVDEPIVVSTVHSVKGLEFANVVMCGLGESTTGDAAIRSRNTLYVGFTRAIDELAVVTTDDNPFAVGLSSVASARDTDED